MTNLLFLAVAVLSLVVPQSAPFVPPADMQTVHVVLLMKGPNAGTGTPAEQEQMQMAHVGHLGKLGAAGHAYIAGPMGDNGDLRGIILMKAASADAAKALEAEDPAVKADRLRIEVVSYMSPANWFSFKPIPTDIKMRQHVFGYLNVSPAMAAGTVKMTPELQMAHLNNLWALRDSGALIAAGPAQNSATHAGVVIFALDKIEDARALLEKDPAVKAGLFTIELHPWFAADRIVTGK